MKNEEIIEEILRRYRYLYENKEIILSLCIKYDIEEEYYKKCLKGIRASAAKFKKDGFKGQELRNILAEIENGYKENLKTPRPYLMDKIPETLLSMFEDFLIQDAPLEESALYQEVEKIKEDEVELAHAEYLIEDLRKRRKLNQHLKNRNPFTVWRILDYVRKNNSQNGYIHEFLDIYYNLDRCVTSGLKWESGYYLFECDNKQNEEFINSFPSTDSISGVETSYETSAIMSTYKGNIFEKEDEYFEVYTPHPDYEQSVGPKTDFVYKAIYGDPIPEEWKQKLAKELNGNSKKYIY